MQEIYAQALLSARAKGGDEMKLVDNLLSHLKAVGRLKLLPGILRELKTAEARNKVLGARIEVASEDEKASAKKEAEAEGIRAETITVNHALIRGWRAQEGGRLIDRSAKRMLTDIYQNVVAGK